MELQAGGREWKICVQINTPAKNNNCSKNQQYIPLQTNLNRAKLTHCSKSSGLYRNTNSIKMYEDYINNFKTVLYYSNEILKLEFFF